MSGTQARWSLNGYNLMFEALGTFQTNVNPDTNIVSFKLPNWILNKITAPVLDVVDIFRFSIVNQNSEISNATLMIAKTSDRIIFNAPEGITFTQPVVFRIRYNLIIEWKKVWWLYWYIERLQEELNAQKEETTTE